MFKDRLYNTGEIFFNPWKSKSVFYNNSHAQSIKLTY